MTARALSLLLSCLRLLGICGVFSETALADPAVAEARLCELRLQRVLSIRLDRLKAEGDFPSGRVHEATPLSASLAADYRLLKGSLEQLLEGVRPGTRARCFELGARLTAQLESFFERRFAFLFSRGQPEAFFDEYRTLLAPWGKRSDRRKIEDRFAAAETEYLRQALPRFQKSLAGTRWQRFMALVPQAERWGGEWETILGQDAAGGVLLASQRMAIQVGELDPVSLRIVFFHELAHLADPQIRQGGEFDERESEVYAWGETLEYLALIEHEGASIPPRFERARAMIRDPGIGLRKWVEQVVASRR